MSQKELLKEFWEDYRNVINPRCFKIAERYRKSLIQLQKTKGEDSWLRIKDLVTVKTRGNVYTTILWVRYLQKSRIMIKTTIWFSYLDSKTGQKRIVLLPSEELSQHIIVFTPGFFKEWKTQLDVKGDDINIQAEFFKWVEGKYTVYHNSKDRTRIEVDLNDLGAGLGDFIDPGRYEFKHFLGDQEIEKMQKKVGNILDPIELWDSYYKKPEVVIDSREIDPNYNYFEEQKLLTLDEIFEKYE